MDFRLEIAGRSDVGMKRKNNEDSMFFSEEDGLCVVADGMGGLEAGEVASGMAVEVLAKQVIFASPTEVMYDGKPDVLATMGRFAQLFGDWLRRTNSMIYERHLQDPMRRKMGTTIAIFYQRGEYGIVANVGDARIYRLRQEKLVQISHDHSWVEELSRIQGVQVDPAVLAKYKNIVTRALGVGEAVQPDVQIQKLMPNDVFLLCSDGLSNMVADHEIESIMVNAENDLERGVDFLIDMANHRGGLDNISVILGRVVEMKEGEPVPRAKKSGSSDARKQAQG